MTRVPLPPFIESDAVPPGTIYILPSDIGAQLPARVVGEPFASWALRAFRERPDLASQCAIITGVTGLEETT